MELKFNSRIFLAALMFWSCNNGPKVIEANPESPAGESGSGIFQLNPDVQVTPPANNPFADELHRVMVKEALPATRYVFLNVEEAGKTFWIATRKKEVEPGEIYFYRGGLLKTMFESKEYNKMFDTIYLVANLVSSDHSKHLNPKDITAKNPPAIPGAKVDIPTHTDRNVVHKGTIKISELVKDPKKYEGHTIQISGKCVKVNPNIMERNWIHVQDGTQDAYDLVVTSNSYVPEGKEFTMRAVVNLNRDFGAGYTYDLILENGELIE